MSDPRDRLTERERECLALVARGLSSKEIAVQLNISHNTVDIHLRRAIKATGASNRRDAARRAAALEPDNQELITQPRPLAEVVAAGASMPPIPRETDPHPWLQFLRLGRQTNDLSPQQRLFWIVVIALVMLIAVANFINGLGVLYDLGTP